VGTGASFLGGQRDQGVKLTTHLYLVPRLRLRGAVTVTSPYVFMDWCLVKQSDNFTFTFTFTFNGGEEF